MQRRQAGYLDELLQQRLEVLPHRLLSAQLQAAQGLGVEPDLGGRRVPQHLATQPHRQVVVDAHLLHTDVESESSYSWWFFGGSAGKKVTRSFNFRRQMNFQYVVAFYISNHFCSQKGTTIIIIKSSYCAVGVVGGTRQRRS